MMYSNQYKHLLLITLFAASGAAFGQKIFKWTDSNGVVHYSSQPVESANEFKVSQRVPEPPPAENEPKPDPEFNKVVPTAGPTKKQIAKRKAFMCEQGRELVETIEPRTRIGVEGPDGEVRQLSDQERLDRLAEAKQLVADNC